MPTFRWNVTMRHTWMSRVTPMRVTSQLSLDFININAYVEVFVSSTWNIWRTWKSDTGWRRLIGSPSCRSFSTEEPLNIGHFCRKWPIKIRDPMSRCHPVSDPFWIWSTKMLTYSWDVTTWHDCKSCQTYMNESRVKMYKCKFAVQIYVKRDLSTCVT